MPDSYSKNIVYLSKAQYQTLITNNTITVDGVTVTYNKDDIYVTPQDEPVTDVRINNVSIAADGVANIPVASSDGLGVVKSLNNYGVYVNSGGYMQIYNAPENDVKGGTQANKPIVPSNQHASTFYGLAKAAGDTTQSASSNAVGTYTAAAKQAIQSMLGIESSVVVTEIMTGTTPTITGVANHKYMCSEVTSVSITPPAAGTIDVIFISGSTPTVLTLPNTVKLPEWFDATSLNTNTIYEINISEGVYGAVMSWPS